MKEKLASKHVAIIGIAITSAILSAILKDASPFYWSLFVIVLIA